MKVLIAECSSFTHKDEVELPPDAPQTPLELPPDAASIGFRVWVACDAPGDENVLSLNALGDRGSRSTITRHRTCERVRGMLEACVPSTLHRDLFNSYQSFVFR
jgi:hypothetical protein